MRVKKDCGDTLPAVGGAVPTRTLQNSPKNTFYSLRFILNAVQYLQITLKDMT